MKTRTKTKTKMKTNTKMKMQTQTNSTALRCRSFFGKNTEKSTCAVIIRITVTFGNQIFM